MSVSSTFNLGGDDGHVCEGHEGGALGVLDTYDCGFALTYGNVRHESIEGCAADGFIQSVEVRSLAGHGLVDVGAL